MAAANSPSPTLAPLPGLDLADIQGIVLRSYKMPYLRVLALRLDDAAKAKALLRTLTDGGLRPLRIQSAECWDAKPASCLNAGLTYDGLKALEVPDSILQSFPEEFAAGAAGRADMVGDTGPNDPANWFPPFNTAQVHMVVTIYAQTEEALETATGHFRAAASGGATELACLDAVLPASRRAHFGYVDGISQPRVAGVPRQQPDGPDLPDFNDPMTLVPAGSFVLGYESSHPGLIYPMPSPGTLGKNGSFAALRVLKQDCAAFERFLDEGSRQTGLDRELVAAKLCGRWRNGVPLALSPDTPAPTGVQVDEWNQFDYGDDPAGHRCPLGAHIRRNNPRSTAVAGDGGERHRIMRRGLPYGPPFDPAHPDDGIERGLLGLFICASLRDQFEFLMKEWVSDGDFAGLGPDKDPILGNQPAGGGRFRIPNAGQPPGIVRGLPAFITTRAGSYCFLPSVTALRYLAANRS